MKYDIKKIKEVEVVISRNLFIICAFITVVAMAMSVIEFFSRGTFFPTNINLFYLGVLAIYSLHKELVRWLGHSKIERQGEYFVYAWVILTTTLYIINFASKDFYSYLVQGGPSGDLRDIAILTLEVLAIFILTRCLKIFRIVIKERNIKI